MDNQNSCNVRRELIRILIERVQGQRVRHHSEASPEPEKVSPKVRFEVEDMLNNPYMNRDEVPLAMDIFKPVVSDDTELPVIVYIHGGGLVLGDRTMSRSYGRALASRGYLVFSIEYRLAPRANACEQLDDVCAGMDCIGRRLVDFNVDFTRVFLTAESAGAYLAIYVAAMKNSKKLQKAIGYEPTRMVFKALGLHCGMFYTDRCDPIGWLLEDQFYGDKMLDENFKQYLDPENDEILKNLPPVFLTTSRGDFLNNYTLMYHEALKNAERESHLVYYGDNDLGHAFVATSPHKATSIDAIDKMVDYFELKAKEGRQAMKRIASEKKKLEAINARIENGKIIEQKTWKFIKELNSYSHDIMSSTALSDGKRNLTYRQMFRMWEHYAEAFSALDITGKNHSRVMLQGTPSIETICAMYGLNMTGATVSLIRNQAGDPVRLRDLAKREMITDIIVPDIGLTRRQLSMLKKEQKDLGIRNIIVMHIPRFGWTEPRWAERDSMERYIEIKKTPGVLFMDDLLRKYEATPISYSDEQPEDAFIIHTSGTTTGKRKSVPVSDRGLNETARRMLADPQFAELRNNASSCLFMELSIAYVMYDMLNLPLAFGGRVTVLPFAVDDSMKIAESLLHHKPNIVFTLPPFLRTLIEVPARPNLSFVELVFIGGGYVSPESKKLFDNYLKECGTDTKCTIGYGNSEAGAAVILSTPDRDDDSIGYPLPGVKVRLYDEEKEVYLDPADGPCRGVLHICSPSISSGRIGKNVLFELTDIDGEKYLNTYDLVETREDGAFYFVGRMNKFFVNNSGVRFDAGLVERAVSAQPGIEGCGIAPRFSRMIRDTVPSMYVQTSERGRRARDTVRKALIAAYIDDDLFGETYLPFEVTITDEIPYNDGGKVDIYKITTGGVSGRKYGIVPVTEDGVLKDIKLEEYKRGESDKKAMPDELKKHDDR
ncbi:MAG: AMP-binding protein [Mogibacterium sp.]|nr:AMP-binding protein [Mogibacterium sp.]